jgi:hypothetical protein
MRVLFKSTFVLAVFMLSACNNERSDPEQAAFQAKLDSALAITDIPKRDSALAKVAADAGAAGFADIARKAVSKITDIPARDNAASTAALNLATAGKHDDAKDIAKSITDIPKRDNTLSQLAKGAPGG